MVSKIGICQLIATIAFCNDYYLTYQFTTKNSIATGDRVYISRAMTKYDGDIIHTFNIDTNSTTEKDFIEKHQDEIIENSLEYEAKIKSYSSSNLNQIYLDTNKLSFNPKRIRIELKEGFAIISIIK